MNVTLYAVLQGKGGYTLDPQNIRRIQLFIRSGKVADGAKMKDSVHAPLEERGQCFGLR